MKTVEKIERKLPVLKTRKRVAAYARVSMESERMQHSLSAQVSYYSALIQKNPEWEYAGVFADYGISGTGTKKREEFNRMLAECEAGNIDIILTKSIQRFARNTVDLLNTVRHLKDLGIEVRFEKENINSLSGDGELMLSILASFAQEESRSISENVKWGTIKRFKQGIPNGKFSIFGYEWQDDKLVIVPEEAEIIRWMYAEYMKGASRIEIGRALMDRGIYTRQGKPWVDSNVKVILTNITYTGNMLFQKEYCEDPITKHRRKNYGEMPQYFVEDTHEAIIPMDEWQAVQAEFKRRRDLGPFGNKSLKLSAFSTKITCGCCRKHYRHSGKRNTAGEVYYIWICQTKSQKGVSACPSKNIPEKMLQNTAAEVLGLDEFDEDVFSQQIEEVIVIGDDTLTFRFYDGHEVTTKWQSTAKIDGKYEIVREDRAKTKSSLRSLPLVDNIREKLLALKEQQKENKRICGNCYNREYDGYVFVDVMGNIFNPRNLSSNFSKLLELKGLRHIRFHDLRHSCASLLLANDVPMKQIQEWLGHSDISTTANIYSHLDYKSKLTSANVMDNVLTLPETEAVGWQT